ncbi:methylmalonyl-CoA mutase family protein [Salinactinospora qingdaonensis]|uniref:Methylmalonyl-CoA mutase family protein n=1 Tax=Salinactinospora qingdaonensis TaxID=702744 RepID=A0ABP7F3L8_9ACTN
MRPPDRETAVESGAPAQREQWRGLIADVLRKSGIEVPHDDPAPEERLSSTTYDGITIRPLYTAEDETADPGFPGVAPFLRGGRPHGATDSGWDVRQRHTDPDPEATRDAIAADLNNGVTSIWLSAGDTGVPVNSIGDVLADVSMDLAPVVLDAGDQTPAAVEELLRAHSASETPTTTVSGNVGFDPLSVAARSGEPAAVDSAARDAVGYAGRLAGMRLMVADATPYHEAGGSDAQELGASMASGVAYLRALTDAGLGLSEAARKLEFRYAANADQFATIAKLRAARAMWARVLEVCGLAASERAMVQHVVTSPAMMTRRDPYVNMPRVTVACFAAGVGGADAVTALPFDEAVGLPDGFARRIARNTQSLLLEESHLGQVIDPAGGSFYVEELTRELYAAGWAFFQEIEGAGGMAEALASGLVAERVDAVWQRRRDRIAHRLDPLTGVSEYPDLSEPTLERWPAPAPARPRSAVALPRHRYAEDFETLRDRSDAHLAETGHRPKVFLATLGPVAAHTARATFAANLFQAGGIEPVSAGATAKPEEVAALFRDSGARVACLCSSDKVYVEQAGPTVAALRAAGARRVLLAGKPPAGDGAAEGDETAAVDGYVFTGCDARSLLEELNDCLGVA